MVDNLAKFTSSSDSFVMMEDDSAPRGSEWSVVLVRAGESKNGYIYPVEVLAAAVELFDGAKAFADHPTATQDREQPNRSINEVVGWFSDVFLQGDELMARLHLSEAAEGLRTLMADAWARGKRDLIGLSVNVMGSLVEKNGQKLVDAITDVVSVDLVTRPAAGGRFVRLVAEEGAEVDTNDLGSPVEDLGEEDLKGITAMDDDRVKELITEQVSGAVAAGINAALADREIAATEAPAADPAPEVDEAAVAAIATQKARAEEATASIVSMRCSMELEAGLAGSKLPEVARQKIRDEFGDKVFASDDLKKRIRDERDYLANFASKPDRKDGAEVEVGSDDADKFLKRFQGVFAGKDLDGIPRFQGFKEAYSAWRRVRGLETDGVWGVYPTQLFEELKPQRGEMNRGPGLYERRIRDGLSMEDAIERQLRESITSSTWGQVFADVLYNRLVAQYNTSGFYDQWRLIVSDISAVSDFRTQHVTRVGGFADLGSVSEQGTYPNLTSPTDEEVTFAIQKYGGLHDITMETIVDDNIGAIRRLPENLARAAARTLNEDIIDLVTTDNPTMDYDSTALYIAGHSNTGTTALTISGLATTRSAMRTQTAYNESAFFLGELNVPKILIVPNEIEMEARRIVSPSSQYVINPTADTDASADARAFAGDDISLIVHDKFTDVNDWFAIADPAKVPTVVVGFLNGQDTPELLVQDNPSVGSVFTADKITTKVRHIWGRDVIDHRSFYRQVVA